MTTSPLTTVERLLLAQQHRILAKLVTNDHDQQQHDRLAEALEQGFVSEYDELFATIEPELSAAECRFVMDVLDMFTVTEHSLAALPPAGRAQLGDRAEALRFAGFDQNDPVESRMLAFARHLIQQGRWEDLAHHFKDRGGVAHTEKRDSYRRMLANYRDVRDLRDITSMDPYTAEELRRVTEP